MKRAMNIENEDNIQMVVEDVLKDAIGFQTVYPNGHMETKHR